MTDADPARGRFIVLSVLRFGGVAIALTGISIVAKRWIEPADILGPVLIVVGVIDVLVLPVILAGRWRSPPDA